MVREKRERTYGVKLVRGPFVKVAPHPLAVDSAEDLPELVAKLRCDGRLIVADLFCGAGGMSLGFEEAGCSVVLGVDHDTEALETHRSISPGLSVNWDLSDPDVIDRVVDICVTNEVDVICGGPPCQPFSRAGRSMIRELVKNGFRDAHDRRRDLWQSFLQVVLLARPRAMVMENVPDMALLDDALILRTMVEQLEAAGYSVSERLVETWRYGVPQMRSRLILVALRDGVRFEWPKQTPAKTTLKMAIGDLPPVEGGDRPEGGEHGYWAYENRKLNPFQKMMRSGLTKSDQKRIYDHITRPVREDDRLAFEGMDSKTKYSDLPESLRRYRSDIFDDKYKRLDADDLCRTITAHIAKDGYWYIHPSQHRTLTIREAARVQTFPDRIRFAGPPSAAFRQIGNAVPPLLGRRIGEAVWESLRAGRPAGVTTSMLASRLSDWWTAQEGERTLPWLDSSTRWVVVQAEVLLDRAAPGDVREAMDLLKELETPAETLRRASELRMGAKLLKREKRLAALLTAAEWLDENPEHLQSRSDLAATPGVGVAVAELACRVVPNGQEDPVLMTKGVLRVATMFTGRPVAEQNSQTEGRVAVARLVGVGETADYAHLGLIELAQSICVPQKPQCGRCPLEGWCVHASGRTAVQPSLW